MNAAADTSVVVAALLEEHPAHEQAEIGLARTDCSIQHVMFESYSVLTRLPGDMRVESGAAAHTITRRLPEHILSCDPRRSSLLDQLADAEISAGATYDGLIALTAREHGIRVISRDRRAARTYASLGVPYELL